MNASAELRERFERATRRAWIVGAAGLLVWLAGLLLAPEQAWRSYLLAFLCVVAIPAGSLSLLLVQHLSGGRWGFLLQRPLEAAARSLPLMALFFVPVILGMHHLYEWTHADVLAEDELLRHRAQWLNPQGFVLRAAGYFLLWSLLGTLLARWSRQQDRGADPGLAARMRTLSGPGLVLYGVALTGATLDWSMSLEPHWFSTMYGMLFAVGWALSALVFMSLLVGRLAATEPLRRAATPARLQDLGSLSFALIMAWAYLSFAQFLIVWSGNLPEEVGWYLQRSAPGWRGFALFLAVFHFGVPFFLLMARRNKRRARPLTAIAALLVLMRAADVYWHVVPAFRPEGPRLHLLDLAALLGVAGIWLAVFLRLLAAAPLLPMGDPRFAAATAEPKHA